jgi:ATP-binding cassette subfamily B protein
MSFLGNLQADKYDRNYSDAYLAARLWRYMSVYRSHLIGIVTAFTLVAIISSARTIWIAAAVDQLVNPDGSLTVLLVALLLSPFLEYYINALRRWWLSVVIGNLIAKMREDAFRAAVDRDLSFYDTNKTGKIVSRITSDTQEFGDIMLATSDVVAQLIAVVFLTVVLVQRSLTLTVILFLTLPLYVVAVRVFRWLARRATRQGSRAMALVNDNIQESVTGISVAKNFRREAMIYEEFSAVNRTSYQINVKRGFVLAMVFPVLNGLVGISIGTVLYAGARLVMGLAMTPGDLFLFVQAVDRFFFPVINLASFWSQFQQGLSALERVFALVDVENTIQQIDCRPAHNLRGEIEFRKVDFAYIDNHYVLRQFDLSIRAGETVAFVGHTGSGKSTIAKLVTRFYEFQGGQILIDGQDIRTFDLRQYRARLGIVPQQPFLFSGTILENIRFARPDATDQEIEALARSVGGGEWLETLPDGLHSHVGERGGRLSMGQRQLVSLLRVMVQRPAIFILDEATASIDPFTEMQIQDAVDRLLAQSTSILIAHRLSTVRRADRIIVLRDGQIIEQGNHDTLMQAGGHYAELYDTYFRHQSLEYVERARETLSTMPGD